MLISPTSEPENLGEPGLEWWSNERWHIGWKGLFYWPGEKAGAASAIRLARELEHRSLAAVACELSGVFGLFLLDRESRQWSIMVDNAGLYRVFHDEDVASTSFLDLLAHRREGRGNDIHLDGLLDYLAHCAVFEGKTPIEGVAKLQMDEILRIDRDGSLTLERKAVPAPDVKGDIETYFADLAIALEGRRLSVDLTGGFDSRVVACMLHANKASFDGAMTGFTESDDSRSARAVAAEMGCEFHFHVHDISMLEEDIPLVFRGADGATEMARFHRDRQNNLARIARGVEAIAHGGAGELFRDHNYVQDFPFYGSSKSRIERLYDLRIRPVPLPAEYFSAEARAAHAGIKPRAIAILEKHVRATNNETYDSIYFHVRSPDMYGPTYSSYINMGLWVAAPMLDRRNANLAIGMDPWKRFMQGWHRQMITGNYPKLATIRTDEGFSASNRTRDKFADLWTYGEIQTGRVGRKLTERYLGKSLFHRVGAFTADPPDYHAKLRASGYVALAIKRLQEADILATDLDPASIRPIHVPRILAMGLLADHIR